MFRRKSESFRSELDLSTYATKADSKREQVLIHQNLLKKLKSD